MNVRIFVTGYSWLVCLLTQSLLSYPQHAGNPSNEKKTLQDCIHYALQWQPALQQAKTDQRITEKSIGVKLADWLPAVNFNYNVAHYFQLPTTVLPNFSNLQSGQKIRVQTGIYNTSAITFSASQNIFNRDVFIASRTANDSREAASQVVVQNTIQLIVSVSKAFYDALLSQEQLKVLDEDILRLQQNTKDAYSKYEGGLTDKTDYKQAQIALNNISAQRRLQTEQVKIKYSVLKQSMGYLSTKEFYVLYDTINIEKKLVVDTNQLFSYENRIEYQLLQTQVRLLQYNVLYQKLAFAPSAALFGSYNFLYFNDHLSEIYSASYPNSLIGLQISVPLFQGFKRIRSVNLARLQKERTDWDKLNLETQINTEYVEAMSSYKNYLYNWKVQKENMAMAREVLDVVNLQYRSGIKTFLDVTVAETDLRTSELNYLNALYQILSATLDVEKAIGSVNTSQ